MSGTIQAIYLAPSHGAPQQPVQSAVLAPGQGLRGDRYAGPAGIVTLIEAEAIERFRAATGLAVAAGDIGRNIVTQGVSLNDLVGRSFKLGEAVLEGMELCEPCATLGARLATPDVSAAAVVKAFTHSAGIRAYVRTGATIAPGGNVTGRAPEV